MGKAFVIDVKGAYKKNFWVIKPKGIKADLYYVLAFVPDKSQNVFYIFSQSKLNSLIEFTLEKARESAVQKGKPLDKAEMFPSINWGESEKWNEGWGVLPDWED